MNNPDNEQLGNALEKFKTALDLFSEEATGAEYSGQPFWDTKVGRQLDDVMISLARSIAMVEENL